MIDEKSKVFIMSTCVFPHGSASANYIQNLSQALLLNFSEVILISNGDEEKCEYDKKSKNYHFKGITFDKLAFSNNVEKYYFTHYAFGKKMLDYAIRRKISSKDIIIVYSSDYNVLNPILKYARRHGIKIFACIVEWFPESLYCGKSFKKYNMIFEKIYPQFDLLFPISTYIAEGMEKYGAKSYVIPIMADITDSAIDIALNTNDPKRKFLVVANGMMKDQISSIFSAINKMNNSEINEVEFHFKGVKEEKIRQALCENKCKYINKNIFIYGWMEYKELTELYSKMDFLLLPRETNQMTMANFPSKVPEVMKYGIVPIVSKVGDYTSLYLRNNRDSIVMDGSDENVCLENIRYASRISQESLEKMKQNAIRTVKEKFDYHVWSDKIYATIRDACK